MPYRCDTRMELQFHPSRFRDLIVQEYLPGSTRSTSSRVIRNPEMAQFCPEVALHPGLIGTNLPARARRAGPPEAPRDQLENRRRQDLLDAAGVDIPKLLLDLIDGTGIAAPLPKEILLLRYDEEVVLDALAR